MTMKKTARYFALLAGWMMLWAMPAKAEEMPDHVWYVFGDTVSLGYPRITISEVERQITKADYDSKSYGTKGIYDTETDGTNTYYFYTESHQDTVTLVFSAQKDYSGDYQVVGYRGRATTLNDLWKIIDVTPYRPSVSPDDNMYWPRERVRMRARNIGTGLWLTYTVEGTHVDLSLTADSTQSQAFGYYMDEEEANYHYYHDERATSFLPLFFDNSNLYFLQSNANGKEVSIEGTKQAGNYMRTTRTRDFVFQLTSVADRFMQCFQWTQGASLSFDIQSLPFSTTFGYAKDDAAAQSQAIVQEYAITMIDSANLYCKYAREHGMESSNIMLREPVLTDKATELEQSGISAKFYWASNGKGAYDMLSSVLKGAQINNALSNVAGYNDSARTMLTRSEETYNGHWKVTVTPNGRSPYNVVDTAEQTKGVPTNFADLLYCDVVMNGTNSVMNSKATRFARTAYRQVQSSDSIYVTVDPANPMLDAKGGTATFTYSFEEVKTEIRYTAAGTIDSVYSSVHQAVAMKDLDKVQFQLLTADNQTFSADWITDLKVDTANSKVTFTFTQNQGVDMRDVKLVCVAEKDKYYSTSFNYIRQYSTTEKGDINFVHTKGGYADLMPKNARDIQYQRVHTVEKTIYYTSGEEIALVANEFNMRGYWRWYDYDTDLDPQYYWDNNGKVQKTTSFWTELPKDKNGKSFTAINANKPSTSRGYYCTNTNALPWGESGNVANMIPLIKGWSDKQKRNIALDASAYQDFTIKSDEIQEPTLSYRQIWHLLPAEEMADSLAKCTSADQPYETHEYIAPINQNVYLATNLTHRNYTYHQSEFSYWFYGKNRWSSTVVLMQVGADVTAKWRQRTSTDGGTKWSDWSTLSANYTNDYQKVSSNTAQKVQYALYVPSSSVAAGNDLYIALFTVTYVQKSLYGPSSTELMSRQEVVENYNLLAEQDFNFSTKQGSLDTDTQVFYTSPLAAENSSFGFVYTNASGTSQRSRQKAGDNAQNFPYYGEYCLVNQITAYSWAKGVQHGGAANGYMMYVDGKKQPGLVTTISTDVQLCSGQLMYCYLWICNPQTGGSLPIFRFDVQGRNSDSEEWQSAGAYFAGELALQSGWKQVNFPVVSAQNYSQTRIAVYNFANDVSGNDFLIDDVCLYSTKLPLQAYQAFTSCDVENMTVAVARIDYDNMTSSATDQNLYYAIQNTKAEPDTLVGTVYHYPSDWAGTQSDRYGVIYIPKKGYNPTTGGEKTAVFNSATMMIDSLETLYMADKNNNAVKDGYVLKGYVKTTDKTGDRYILYVAHLISNRCTPSTGKYRLNMAATLEELSNPDCAMMSDLSILGKTNIKFGNGETDTRLGACANGLYPVTVNVSNTLDIDNQTVTLTALAKADWLLGYAFDDVYDPDHINDMTEAEKSAADAAFVAKYGYTRGKVQDALSELRRYPNISNFTANDVSQIVQDTIGTDGKQHNVLLDEHYNLIVDLCHRGLLKLYKDSDQFYMRQQDTLRYWIFPIAGTAKVSHNGIDYTLDNCSSRTFLRACTGTSNHTVNLSPIALGNMTDEQKHAIPRVRVAAKLANTEFSVPVTEITDRVVFGWDSCRVVSSTDPVVQKLIDEGADVDKFSMRYTQDRIYQYVGQNGYYKSNSTIKFRPVDAAHVAKMKQTRTEEAEKSWKEGQPGFWHANTHTMRPGYEYTMMVTLLNTTLQTHDQESGVDASCAIGTVYFTVVVVPDTVIWAPSANDYWGDDDNWHAIINGKETEAGKVPLAETDVVLPTLSDVRQYPYLCDSVFYPMDANYVTARCHKIQFQYHSTLLNQQKLQYDSVYVDLTMDNGSWSSISVPLKDVYSGDFYVPFEGIDFSDPTAKSLESKEYFHVNSFHGVRDSSAAFAAWSTYYNDKVGTENYSPSGNYNTYNVLKDSSDLVFYTSNTLVKKIEPCHGTQLGIWGPDALTDDQIVIRLPKPDTKYYMYLAGYVQDSVTVDRTNAHKFAFEPDQNGQMKVTLHNETPSPWFLWGNPTMAYVDAEAFFYTNSDKLETYYKVMSDGVWYTRNRYNVTYQTRFVKPYQSVLIYAKNGEKLTDLEVTLDVNHLATSNMQGARSNYTPSLVTRAPRHAHADNGHYLSKGLMHITAGVRYTGEMKAEATAVFDLVATDFANDGYDVSEDAPFISTGIADDGTTRNGASEMNMYSLVGSKGLSVDVREQIGIVPLAFLVSNDAHEVNDGKMTLQFTLTDWAQECYLIDAQTGTKTRIINGTELTVDIPENHELRYYIQGPKQESKGDDTPTDNGAVVTPDAASRVSVFSPMAGVVNITASADIAAVRLYDAAGLLVAEKSVSGSPVLTMAAPAGVLVAEVRLADGTIAREKVFVR